ncbi:MAG: prenyltransferase/squalene oxidase repeat-containing protein [Planctomycetota bacterium]
MSDGRRAWLISVARRTAAAAWMSRLSLTLATSQCAAAQGAGSVAPNVSREVAMKSATLPAVRRGLEYLAKTQNPDGSFGVGLYSRNVGVCGLAGLAMMADGNTPSRGTFGRAVERVLAFLSGCCRDSGFVAQSESASHGPMYEHGFATLFLAEAYGMARAPGLREKLASAVRLIIETQNREGGWRYFPERRDADISVTICQVMALRAAKNAGLYVPPATIDRCVDYIRRSQNSDGGFMYQLAMGGPSKFPRSAAAVVALNNAGIYGGPEVERALDYVMEFLPGSTAAAMENHFLYGHYYAVQAMWQAGGDRWRRWYPAIEAELSKRQQADGAWLDSVSPVYGTAMACLILLMPRNHLPVFQK